MIIFYGNVIYEDIALLELRFNGKCTKLNCLEESIVRQLEKNMIYVPIERLSFEG